MYQKLLIDIGGTLSYEYFADSIKQIPTSAKITIYDDAGAEKVAQVVATIATDGTMSYVVSAAICDDVYYNWKAVWEFVVGGVTLYRTAIFYIVRQILTNPVTDDDIINAAPFLKNKNYREIFTADSGSATTIVTAQLTEANDYWNGGTAEVIAGTNLGKIREITDWALTTGILTVKTFGTAIDNTSKVVVTRTYKAEIDRAFNIFLVDLKNRGIYADQIIDADQTKEYIIAKTLELICMNFSGDAVDVWASKAEIYKDNYKKMLSVAVFDYDDDDDGNIEEDEASNSMGQSAGVR